MNGKQFVASVRAGIAASKRRVIKVEDFIEAGTKRLNARLVNRELDYRKRWEEHAEFLRGYFCG